MWIGGEYKDVVRNTSQNKMSTTSKAKAGHPYMYCKELYH